MKQEVASFLDYVAHSPTVFQATQQACDMLDAAGFTRLSEHEAWEILPGGRYYVTRNRSALVAFAGPPTNLALALGFTVLCFVCFKLQLGTEFTWEMLYYAGELNVVLFLLNLFPVPGFDGWYILENFFPRFVRQSSEAVRGAFFVDIGDAGPERFQFQTVNMGIGYGLRIKLPNVNAPIRLDLAFPIINKQDGVSNSLRFHFNMGASFGPH